MIKFFKQEKSKRKGRPKTSIVSTLRQDLKKLSHTTWSSKLSSLEDLEHLRHIATDRKNWRQLVSTTKLEIDGERQPRSGCIAKEDLKSVIVTTPTSGQKEFFFKKYQ